MLHSIMSLNFPDVIMNRNKVVPDDLVNCCSLHNEKFTFDKSQPSELSIVIGYADRLWQ